MVLLALVAVFANYDNNAGNHRSCRNLFLFRKKRLSVAIPTKVRALVQILNKDPYVPALLAYISIFSVLNARDDAKIYPIRSGKFRVARTVLNSAYRQSNQTDTFYLKI